MTSSPSSRRHSGWAVVGLNGAVAGTVLVLVAVLALVVKPPAPPGIAAFAPEAAKPITKAPQSQSAQFGNGTGQCVAGQVCTHVTPPPRPGASGGPAASVSPPTLTGAAPAGLQCFSWPDGAVTQTFDPQSPPCISTWDDSRGNGGATSPGVSATTIRVAFPITNAASSWPDLQPIVDFFNSHFQFYGRHIKIIPVASSQAGSTTTGDWNDPTEQKADAAAITQQQVFASTDFLDPIPESWTLPVFFDTLAQHKIISINGGEVTPYTTAPELAKQSPYVWSYYQTIDQLMSNVATMTCRQLVGKPAIYAPDSTMHTKTRKFAVFLPTDSRIGGPMPGLNSLLSILDACGVHNPPVVRYAGGRTGASDAAAQFAQLSSSGVTTVIFLPWGGSGAPGSPMLAAQNVGYQPEWDLIGWNNYNTAFQLNDPSTETSGAFGVGIWNKQPQLALEPWHQAAIAGGGQDGTTGAKSDGRAFYEEMLLLASGIQTAGPDLTPQSFANGLHSTTFPDPGAGQAPSYQATVGFGGNSQIMVDDYTAFWLDSQYTGQEVEKSQGLNESLAMCEVALGRRWTLDDWPNQEAYYTPACR